MCCWNPLTPAAVGYSHFFLWFFTGGRLLRKLTTLLAPQSRHDLELEQHIFRSAVQGPSVSVRISFFDYPFHYPFQGVTQIRGD